jgi:hypothetical protein
MIYRLRPQEVKIMNAKNPAADELLARLNEAVAAANEAEKIVTTAQADLVSRSKTVGALLLEAKKLHPVVKDFEAFLRRVDGLKLSRAYDLMRLAGGRTTDEELKKDARERQRKSRASKRKLPRLAPAPKKPEPEPVSVTDPLVTESAEASAEKRKAINTDLDLTAEENAAKASAHNLAEFTVACRLYLPRMIWADQQKALLVVTGITNSKPRAEAA